MFDSPIKFRLAQVQSNKQKEETFKRQYVYVFHCKDELGMVKYIATIKEYENNQLTIEFYPKVHAKDKYKILTYQYRFPSVASTVLAIMRTIQEEIGVSCFGLLAASLIDEIDNDANKRYLTYVNILSRKSDKDVYKVLGVPENSFIFIIPIFDLVNKETIILRYEEIFKETQ